MSRSAFYDWLERPAKIISEEALNMHRTARQLFKRSRGSLGSRQMCKNLRKAGLMSHSDQGSQYTSGQFSRLLKYIK